MFMLLLTGLACVIGGGFVLVCLTTGLMTIAEFVEEHTVLTKRVLRWSIWGTVAVYILMWLLQGFPFLYILLGIICHGCFYALLPKFPFIEFTNLIFLAGVGLSLLNHIAWFRYFAWNYVPLRELLTFFFLCVWLVPFSFFISLASNESTLPGSATYLLSADRGPDALDSLGGKPRHGRTVNRLLSFFSFLKKKRDEILPSSVFNVKAI